MTAKFDGLNTTLIHQLKRKIEELEKSEKLFSDLYKTGMTFSGTSDEILNAICLNVHKIFDGYFVLVNYAKGCEFHFRAGFNLPKAVLALKKEPIKNAICSHVLETKKPLFTNDLKNTKCPHCNTPYSKDGAVKAFDLNTYFGVPIIFSDGSIRGTLCLVFKEKKEPFSEKDINILSLFAKRISIELEREIAQNDLNDEKERYTQLFEQSNDGIILSDFNGKIFGANKKIDEITGYSEKEFLEMHIWQLIPESERKMVGESFKRCLRNKSELVDSKLIRRDGKVIDINVYAKAIALKEGSFVQAIVRDITEKKMAEEKLKESEEKFRAIIDSSADWIFMLDKDYKFLAINKTAANLFGRNLQEIIGESIFKIFPKEIAIQFAKNNAAVFKTGNSKYIEEKMVVRGREFYISTILNPIKDNRGKVIAVAGITRDITERKKAENALKESEEKFRAIFENAGEGILIADAKTQKFIFANPRICKILGYKEKELLKLKVNGIHPKKDRPYVMKQFKKQLQKKMLTAASLPVLRKDKKVIFCDVTATPLIINGKKYLMGFFLEK